ncbi:MAG: FHA domain-containing protein [Aggregatilineales bacterium]
MQQGTERYRLVVRRGPQPNQVYELTETTISLGRDVTNQLVINDREVSRHHLRFTRGQDGYTVEDLGSTNGTFINGKRVSGASLLKDGDMLGLGETVTLGYEVVRGDMPAPVSTPSEQPANPYQAQPDNVYQPPAQQQPDPYQPPAQQDAYQQPAADPYQQPVQDAYEQPAYQQQQPATADPYGGYNPPPPPGYAGYEGDPYKAREEGGSNTTRMFLFGCLGLMVFCCCCTVGSVVLVDSLCLYENLPLLPDVLEALGVPVGCTPAF